MKRLVSIAISAAILAFLYTKVDVEKLLAVLQNCDRQWLLLSLGMVVPLTLLTSWRLRQLMPKGKTLGFGEANRLILAASTLNMVLPSKMGDIVKAYFMGERGHLEGSLALSLVVFEKACDMLSLLLWCAFGLLLYPQKDLFFWGMAATISAGFVVGALLLAWLPFARFFFRSAGSLAGRVAPKALRSKIEKLGASWQEMHGYFWGDRRQLARVVALSVFIWFAHLLQIWFFTFALKATVPFLDNLALAPLAILAGLVPLTFAGVGTRDAALVFLFRSHLDPQTGAALGLLCTSRYLLPAIAGLPFLGQYLTALRHLKKRDRR